MTRHLRRITTALFAATIAAAGLLLATTAPANASLPANTITQLTNSTPCGDIVFLGLRGSGEKPTDGTWGMGNPVTAIYNAFTASVGGKRIAATGVNYPALPVPLLSLPTELQSGNWLNARSTFLQGFDIGVLNTESALIARAKKCQTERIVLAGYSQGAMVIHRMVFDLANSNIPVEHSILSRIDTVGTIGDGDRVPLDDVVTLGSSATEPVDYGIAFASIALSGVQFHPTPALMSTVGAGLNSRWFQVCDAYDPVCDYGRDRLDQNMVSVGAAKHIYGYTAANPGVLSAGQKMAASVRDTAVDASAWLIIGATYSQTDANNGQWYLFVTNAGNVSVNLTSVTSTACGDNLPSLPNRPLVPTQQFELSCVAPVANPPTSIVTTTVTVTALGLDGTIYTATQDVVLDLSMHD